MKNRIKMFGINYFNTIITTIIGLIMLAVYAIFDRTTLYIYFVFGAAIILNLAADLNRQFEDKN